MQFAEGRHDWALLGYLKASEAGFELAQANAAWMLSHDYGIPPGQSARSYVEPGEEFLPRTVFQSLCKRRKAGLSSSGVPRLHSRPACQPFHGARNFSGSGL